MTRANGACSSSIEFMLSKNELMERFISCWSSWRTSDQNTLGTNKDTVADDQIMGYSRKIQTGKGEGVEDILFTK